MPRNGELVGPLGLEPRTKGFTSAPSFPMGVDYLFTHEGVAGRSSLSLSALERSGSLCTFRGVPPAWLRVAIGRAVKVP